MLIFSVCILWVLKIFSAQSLARGMESRKNNVVSVAKFVAQKWVCSKYRSGFYLLGQSGFFLSSHIRFFKNLFCNQSMVFLGFG